MTEVKQVFSAPPEHIYKRAQEAFGVSMESGVIFTYGTNIYALDPLPDHLWVHEKTHVKQQKEMGVEEWWNEYFDNVEFRLKQEVEAYHNQYVFFQKKNGDRNTVAMFLYQIAGHLCSPMYGQNISRQEASKMIRCNKI